MTTDSYTHTQIMGWDVRHAFPSRGTAGRVVSGLLKAAVKRGEIETKTNSGRITGTTVWYVMTEEQLAAIRAEAIKRGALRLRLCTPVTIEQPAALLT